MTQLEKLNEMLGTNLIIGDSIMVKLRGEAEPKQYTLRVGKRGRKRKRDLFYETEHEVEPEDSAADDDEGNDAGDEDNITPPECVKKKYGLASCLPRLPNEIKDADERLGFLKYIFRENGEFAKRYYEYMDCVSRSMHSKDTINRMRSYLKPIEYATDYWVKATEVEGNTDIYTQEQLDRMEYGISPFTGKRETRNYIRCKETGKWKHVRWNKNTGKYHDVKSKEILDDIGDEEIISAPARKFNQCFIFSELVPEDFDGSQYDYIDILGSDKGKVQYDSDIGIEITSLLDNTELRIAALLSKHKMSHKEIYMALGLTKSKLYTCMKRMRNKLKNADICD